MFLVLSTFYFQDFGSSLLSLLWIRFQVDYLFRIHLFGLVGFCIAPSSTVYFSVFSFCLTYCVWGPFCRLHIHSSHCFWCLPPVVRLVQWVEGTVPVFWWVGLDLVFLVGSAASSGVFWEVWELSLILGRLSVNGWGCVPVLLVVWPGASSTGACCLLGGPWSLYPDVDLWESSCWLILRGARRSLVVQCPELGSPTSEAQAWHQAGTSRFCQPHGWRLHWGRICLQAPIWLQAGFSSLRAVGLKASVSQGMWIRGPLQFFAMWTSL